MTKIQLYTVAETARILSTSPNTIYAWIHQRKIPHRKIGGNVRISSTDIEHIIEKSYVKPIGGSNGRI